MTIKDKNRIPELKKRLKQMSASEIRGGVLGNDEIAMIAGVNEFGMKIGVTKKMRNYLASQGLHLRKDTDYINIPERPAIRSAFDDKKNIKQVWTAGSEVYDIDTNLKSVLNKMGDELVGVIRKSIRSNFEPANHPFTIERKGGKDKTLIANGDYVRSITYKIV